MLTRDHLHDLAVMARQFLPNVNGPALTSCAAAIAAAEAEVLRMDKESQPTPVIEAKPAE